MIGTAIIAVAAVLTIATAGTGTALACFAYGALQGAAIGAATGAASGAALGAVWYRLSTGSWKGSGKAALNGAADGYMWGAATGFVTGGLSGKACFAAGTSILTASGHVAIETIKAGDLVWSENPETGEKGYKEVVPTFVGESYKLIHLFIDNEEILTTENHPFWTEEWGWVGAGFLKVGDTVRLSNGKHAKIQKNVCENLSNPIKVYNFEVHDWHTYFVSGSNILVHNKNGWDPKSSKSIYDLLKGGGQLRDLQKNGNLRGVNVQELLAKNPGELEKMAKEGKISSKTLKQFKKAFEGRDLGTKGRGC